jgi:tetratricopeptide (TPR) repeat protein
VAPSDFVSRGQALVAAGQYQEAVKICRLGLLGRPTTVEGRIVLGQALLALRRYDEVLAEMRVALELDNTSASAYQLKGEALLRKGDAVAAIETLTRAKALAQNDPSVAALLAEAEIARDGSAPGVGSMGGYVDLGDSMTKHYPSHQGDEASGHSNSHTRPTSLQKPPAAGGPAGPGRGDESDFAEEAATRGAKPSRGGSSPQRLRPDSIPPPEVLSVGDRSGTVEVDPDLDGVEIDDDFGEVAEPPPSVDVPLARGKRPASAAPVNKPRRPAAAGTPPRAKAPSRPNPNPGPSAGHFLPPPGSFAAAKQTPTGMLSADDLIEVESGISLIETPSKGVDLAEIDRQAQLRARRRSVGMPAGPLDESAPPPPRVSHAQLEAANRPTAIGAAAVVPAHLRPPTLAPGPGAVQAATGAPRPPPPQGLGMMPPGAGPPRPPNPNQQPNQNPAAALPTMALSPALQRSAAAIDQLFPDDQVAVGAAMPAWASRTVVAPGAPGGVPPRPGGPGGPGGPPLPRMPAPPGAPAPPPGPAVEPPHGAIGDFTGLLVPGGPGGPDASQVAKDDSRHPPTGIRRPRSFKIAMWIALGALVIGGGVFAGFQIRRIRLERQIDTATRSAEDAARPDTWLGWLKARDGFAGIVAARDTDSARAKVARARAVLAADFGDDVAGARQAVEALGPTGGGDDGAIGRAYLALAAGDAAAAQTAAQAALKSAPDDAAAHAAVGRAAILARKWSDALRELKLAVQIDPRPAHLVALAEAELGRGNIDDARATCGRSLAMVNDHPATLIMRARVLAIGGKLATGSLGAEVSGQLDRVLAEAARPLPEQTVGVSPRQGVDAALALSMVQLARGDAQGARVALDRATANRPADQRFAEDVITALIRIGQYTQARAEAQGALEKWPASLTARIGLARTQLVDGDHPAALETLARAGDLAGEPEALTLRAHAHLDAGDTAAARTDVAAALAIAPELESAIIAKTEIDLRAGEAAQALTQIEPLYATRPEDPEIATAYAAALRETGNRDKAREVIKKLTDGPDGPQLANAWLELGRLERDVGDYEAARKAYGRAIAGRGIEAKLEAALLYIDDADVAGGRDTLEALVKQAPSDAAILVQTARVRTLLGDLKGARELIARAETLGTAPKGLLERETGRLALKAADFRAAVAALQAAIVKNDTDIEAHLLLLDALGAQDLAKQAGELLEDAKMRFGDKPERYLVLGKVALIMGKTVEARGHFEQAKQELEKKKAPPRRIAEALFGLGRCALTVGDIGVAVKNLEAGLRKDPTAVDVWFALGDIAAADGNLRRALDHYQSAAKYNPDYADLAFQLGRTAFTLGKKPIAKEALSHYIELAPTGEFAAEAKRLLAQIR